MQNVVPAEAERVHGQEAVAGLEDRLAPVRAGMERQHEAALLDRPIDLHVGVLVHARVTHGGDHEAADVLAVAEFLDLAQALVGVVERQAEHRIEAAA